jgi:GDP-mannose 6-dehydrogenase
MRLAVFGLGYVGCVTAAGFAARGHDVVGVDVDTMKVDLIRVGRSPLVEPGIDDLIAEAVACGRLTATTDVVEAMRGADVSLLCVGTPSSPEGGTDLTYLRRAVAEIRRALDSAEPPGSGRHSVVVRSTVPPGTVESVVTPVFADLPEGFGWQVGTAMCPEFLREGTAVSDFFDPPLVVVGAGDPSTGEALAELFSFMGKPVRYLDVRGAESLKYACNAYHAVKVSFANEMGRIFRGLGVDSREVMQVFCEDRSLNISGAYLRPGFAFGGSCLPKDLRSLLHMARMHSLDVPLLAGTIRTNELVISDVLDRVVASDARVVAMIGLSFKSDTDDLRESPNVDLVERLIGKGFEVRIYDPIVNPERLTGANLRYVTQRLPHLGRLLHTDPATALDGCDLALVSSADPAALAALDATPPPRIIDLHGRLGRDVEQRPGYQGIGWAA